MEKPAPPVYPQKFIYIKKTLSASCYLNQLNEAFPNTNPKDIIVDVREDYGDYEINLTWQQENVQYSHELKVYQKELEEYNKKEREYKKWYLENELKKLKSEE